jgi:glycosyltransferase involved in cell wall biosynthesis
MIRIAWIYPFESRFGNAAYSEQYIRALSAYARVIPVDAAECGAGREKALAAVNECDLAHIQYEVTFFMRDGKNVFAPFIRRVRIPRVATIHEVYRDFPNAFPRRLLTGRWPILRAKQILWDMRHPAAAAHERFQRSHFYADILVVHYPFQKEILVSQGEDEKRILIVSHPVTATAACAPKALLGPRLRLGTTGFINRNFDIRLLFESLALCRDPWTFTWIGGLRRDEDKPVLDEIRKMIADRHWGSCFEITGWVDANEQARRLGELDGYLALFSQRSTSGSIMTALAHRCRIIAMRLPLTEAIHAEGGPLLLCDANPAEVAALISKIAADAGGNAILDEKAGLFIKKYSFEAMAKKLFGHYESLIREKSSSAKEP